MSGLTEGPSLSLTSFTGHSEDGVPQGEQGLKGS